MTSDLTSKKLEQRIQDLERTLQEKSRTEEALRESEERFRQAFHTSPDSINLNRASDGKYLDINEGFTSIMGYTRDDAIGRTSVSLNIWKNAQDRQKLVNGLLKAGYVENLEAEFIAKDGSTRIGLMSARLLRIRGEQVILSITRDITKRKRLEAELLKAQKNQALGTLAGGIAHDFNNLLMGIQGHASLLAVNLGEDHSQADHVKGIQEYVDSATALTRQLLGFARDGKYEVRPVDLNDLALSSTALFGRTRREIDIRVKTFQDPVVVEADRGQMEQVLMNLFVNAWQAMPDGGKLFVETSIVDLTCQDAEALQMAPGRCCRIHVADTGVGMDESVRRQIFDPFFTTRENERGTGLGLASVLGIVRNHGGNVTVLSQPGKGSTFTISLPASEKTAGRQDPAASSIASGSGTILLVDDEPMLLDVGKEMLETLGYKVLTALSGPEAIDLVADSSLELSLVILDMVMPGMDGGAVFDQLRSLRPGLPVLLSSGYTVDGPAQSILSRGCDGFIQKPFSLADLSGTITTLLS